MGEMASKEDSRSKLRRHIEMGYVQGEIRPNGAVVRRGPKGIQHWYDTRTLIDKVSAAFDTNEAWSGKRYCPINGKHNIQVRGKHLRRLLKAMPHVKQRGRQLVDERNTSEQ